MLRVTAVLSLASFLLLTGCGNGIGRNTQNVAVLPAVHGISGVVRGGNQPVTGATITLMAAGTSGYGSTGSTLATTTTDTNGNFNITGLYTCPGSDPYVYITSTGGNPGLSTSGGPVNNSAISLTAALTDCNTLKTNAATTYIVINEVTTVAAAYALGQFMSSTTGAIGSYGYANTGLNNAFLTASNLASTSTGTAYSVTPGNNGVVPQSELNTVANILAACVNTSSNTSSGCTTLFGNLLGFPANTQEAALSIALHPDFNASTIFGLAGAVTPFQPALSAAPNDWTVALAFNDSAVAPRGIAIDGNGNVWVAVLNTGGTSSSLNKINPQGVVQNFVTTNVNGAMSLAISDTNNVWLANFGNETLVQYSNTGSTVSGPFTGLNGPQAMAMDPFGNLWITNFLTSSIAEFNTNSNSFTSTSYSGGGITSPVAVAIDTAGNAWVGNTATVTELNDLGVASSSSPISSGGINSPSGFGGIAIDGSNDVWITNLGSADVAELNSSGSALSGSSGYTGTGITSASSVAIDGSGKVWIVEGGRNRLIELFSNGALISPTTGYQGGNLAAPRYMAIDGSGNIWVANLSSTTTGSITTTISEFVGLAAPVVTPQVVALEQNEVGVPPGNPIPVVVQSNALPYFTPGSLYGAQLLATGGNSGTYTWTVMSGGPPSPITVSSSGLISGTTSLTGSYGFTVKVCDTNNSSNCASKTFTLAANSTLAALGNEAALVGSSYAVNYGGFKTFTGLPGVAHGSDFVASIKFGSGGTLTGEIDSNNENTSSTSSGTLTGYYAYGSDNRGTMILIPSSTTGRLLDLAFVGSNFSASTPQTLHFTEFDDTESNSTINVAIGSGIGKLQVGTPTFNQTYVFGLQGETPCNNDGGVNPSCATISPFGPLSAVGEFTANGSLGITSGEEDVAAINNTYNLISLSGSYTTPDAFGRGTLTLTPSGTLYPAPPSHYIYYTVSANEMYMMSSDGHFSKSMLNGDVLAQTGPFTNTTISGNYVAWEMSATNGDGVATYPTTMDSSLLYLTVGTGSQLSLMLDDNDGQGNVLLEQAHGSVTYSIDSLGRMTITAGGGSSSPVFYLANGTQFFATEQPSSISNGGPALITGVQQSGSSFTCPATGTLAVATLQTPVVATYLSGWTNIASGATTLDLSTPYGVLLLGDPGTVTCVADSLTSTTGHITFDTTYGAPNSGYIITPGSKTVIMSDDPTDGQPSIYTVEK